VLSNENDAKLVGLAYLEDTTPPIIQAKTLIAQTVRGERSKQYLLLWRDASADSEWYESLSLKNFRKLSATLPVKKRKLINVEDTPMSALLAALGKAIYEKKNDCPDGMDPKEWRFNLRLAKRRLARKRRSVLKLGEIYSAIIPQIRPRGQVAHSVICTYCHTPLMFGYKLSGHTIRRRERGYCKKTCNMHHVREKERRAQNRKRLKLHAF
jgi:hypothetical protein